MRRNKSWYILRYNKGKSTWQLSCLLDLWYIHSKKTNLGSVLAAGSRGLFLFSMNMLKIEQTWNLSSGKTSSKSSNNFKSLDRPIKSWCFFQSLVPDQSIKFIARATAPQWYCQKNLTCKIFRRKFALYQTVLFLLLSAWIVFWLLKAKYQIQIVERPKFKQHSYIAKAFISPEHIYKHVENHNKLFFW